MKDKKEKMETIKRAQALYYELRERGLSHALALAGALELVLQEGEKEEG